MDPEEVWDHYCTREDAASIRGKDADAKNIARWWLSGVDGLIEQYTGQGYKGCRRTFHFVGSGNRTVRLPSKPRRVLNVKEVNRTIHSQEWSWHDDGRLVTRQSQAAPLLFVGYRPCWIKDVDYTIEYEEPNDVPDVYRLCAATCVSQIFLWAKKNKEFDIAVTAADAAAAGKVSTSSSNTFPASLADELRRTIQGFIKKPGV